MGVALDCITRLYFQRIYRFWYNLSCLCCQGFKNRESMICCLLGERVEIPKLGPPASLKNYSLFNTSAMRDKKKFTNELAKMEIDEDIMEIILRCSEASEKVAEMLSRSNLQSANFSKTGFQNCQGEEVE